MKKTLKYFAGAATMSASMLTVAHAETKNFNIEGFSEVDSSAGVTVIISVGGDYEIRAEGSADSLEWLRVEKKDRVLEIGRKTRNWTFKRQEKPTVYVSMPRLTGVDASSGSDISADNVDAGNFSIDVSSGADVRVSGKCDTLNVDVSSGSDADARDLKCKNVVADASSGADAMVYASESINADASSGGDIHVYGGPENIQTDESSGGDVSIRD